MRSDKKNADRSAQYREILSELWDNLPTARRDSLFLLTQMLFPVDLDVRVTPSYAAWLTKRRGDVASDIRFGNEGKMAVQSVLQHSIDAVDMLLERGVEPEVALLLLPYEIYIVVTEAHRERFEAPPQRTPEAPPTDVVEFDP